MNTSKLIIRLVVLIALCALGLFLIFDPEVMHNSLTAFCIRVFLDKALGVACIIATGFLYNRWCKTDPWLKKYEEWIKEAEQTEL